MTREELALNWVQSSINVNRAKVELDAAKKEMANREAVAARAKTMVDEAVKAVNIAEGMMPAIEYAMTVRKLRDVEQAVADAQERLDAAVKASTTLLESLIGST